MTLSTGINLTDRLAGVLIGVAVGDSLGLPLENLSRGRIARMAPGRPRHRLLPGRGIVSDDTDHTVFVSQGILAHPDDPVRFQRSLAWWLRGWLVSLPPGVGFATLRAILKLWMGFPPTSSGVRSAGNGAAMRAGIIGAVFHQDVDRMHRYVRASTVLTHTDPRALTGARVVARACAWAVGQADPRSRDVAPILETLILSAEPDDREWELLMIRVSRALEQGVTVTEFTESLGLAGGVTGYVHHTVPVALYAWLHHAGDFEAMMTSVLRAGGDTDTVGAIAGAMMGASVGASCIPADWIDGVIGWPHGVPILRALAARLARLADGERPGPVAVFVPGLLPRHLVELVVILGHVVLRML